MNNGILILLIIAACIFAHSLYKSKADVCAKYWPSVPALYCVVAIEHPERNGAH